MNFSLRPRKIIVLAGFRKVGKTYLSLDLIKELLKERSREAVVYINFDDEKIEEWFGTKRKIKYIPLWKWLLTYSM